jgi:hypothetical protein
MEVDPFEMCACADRIQKRARGGPRGSGGNEADPVPPFRSEDVAASEMDPTYLDGHSGGRRHASCDLIHFLSLLRPVPLRQHLPDHVASHVTTSILVSEVARGFRDGPSMSHPWSKCRVQRRWGPVVPNNSFWYGILQNTLEYLSSLSKTLSGQIPAASQHTVAYTTGWVAWSQRWGQTATTSCTWILGTG